MMRFLILIISTLLVYSCSNKPVSSFSGETMGTTYHIKVNASLDDEAQRALHFAIDSVLAGVNQNMSTYIPQSEISRFNSQQSTDSFEVTDDFLEILNIARQIYSESQGAYDVTVGPLVDLWGFGKKGRRNEPPSPEEIDHVKQFVGMDKIIIAGNKICKTNPGTELDFSSIAKGYGVDQVGKLLSSRGYGSYMVEIGGEVDVRGGNYGNPWHIGIDRPLYEATVNRGFQEVLTLTDCGVATSGDYRNYFVSDDSVYSHEINPVTARPIKNNIASTTVIAPNCTLADGMATALMVMEPERGLTWVESKAGVEALIILRENDGFREMMSSGFTAYLDKVKKEN